MTDPQRMVFADARIEETDTWGLCLVVNVEGRDRFFCIEGKRAINLQEQINEAMTRRLKAAWQ